MQANDGSFEIHPLLQQFIAEKLGQQSQEARQAENAHCNYFTERLAQYELQINQDTLPATVARIAEQIDNIRAAWDYAIQAHNTALLVKFIKPLYAYFDVQCRYAEGEHIFGAAYHVLMAASGADSASPQYLLAARMRALQGSMLVCMSRYSEAQIAISPILPILQQNTFQWETRICLSTLGTIQYAFGDYQLAWSYYETALPYYQQAGEIAETVNVLIRLSDIATVLGDFEKARQLLLENAVYIKQMSNKRGRLLFLTTLGDLEYKVGNYLEADQRFTESLSLSEQMNDRTSMGVALVSLGRVAFALGKYTEALELCQKSAAIFRDLDNLWSTSFASSQMGRTYHALGLFPDALAQYDTALVISRQIGSRWVMSFTLRQVSKTQLSMGQVAHAARTILEAVDLAREIGAKPLILDALLGAAEVLQCAAQNSEAATLAIIVSEHPNSEYETRQASTTYLDSIKDSVHGKVELDSLRQFVHEHPTELASISLEPVAALGWRSVEA